MQIVQSHLLSQIRQIRHGFFCPGDASNRDNNLSFKNGTPQQVLSARKRACGILNINPSDLTHVYQDHGTVIWSVGIQERGAGALTGEYQVGVGDALISNEPAVPLAILIADCLPVFFATSDAKAVGLTHAGWRGTFDNISGKTVQRIVQEFQVDPATIKVWIGPGISKANFEVGYDVLHQFKERWGNVNGCLDERNRRIDLRSINEHQLLEAGILPRNLEISPECTYADRKFFSYRRDGAGVGHNMAVIQIATD
ncbi:MAG: peptidoglycan editing factor PgeF [bacterium]